MRTLLRDADARRFLLAHGQSSIGDGVGYVALVLLAYDRLESPWAISLVLLADFLPAIGLGVVFGALADRVSRRRLAVAADLLRAVAFLGLALVDAFAATVAFALLAGTGTAMFRPAVNAALPRLAGPERLAALNAAYGALKDLGITAGPALAAGLMLLTSPETLLVANAVSFALSALLLLSVPLDRPATGPDDGEPEADLSGVRAGLAAAVRVPGVLTMLISAAAVVLAAGGLNVAEPVLAKTELGAGDSGFAVIVACYGVGLVAGSLLSARERSLDVVRRLYLAGILLSAAGLLGSAIAPTLLVAAATFTLTGLGNSVQMVHDQQILQRTVPDATLGRIFGLKDTLESAAFGLAVVGAGGAIALLGVRGLLLAAGLGLLAVAGGAAVRLASLPGADGGRERDVPAPAASD